MISLCIKKLFYKFYRPDIRHSVGFYKAKSSYSFSLTRPLNWTTLLVPVYKHMRGFHLLTGVYMTSPWYMSRHSLSTYVYWTFLQVIGCQTMKTWASLQLCAHCMGCLLCSVLFCNWLLPLLWIFAGWLPDQSLGWGSVKLTQAPWPVCIGLSV